MRTTICLFVLVLGSASVFTGEAIAQQDRDGGLGGWTKDDSRREQPLPGLEKKLADPDSATLVTAATSHVVPGNILKTPTFRMGSVAITNMRIVFGDFEVFEMWRVMDEPAIVLGMDVLGTTSAMMLDFTREELRILPNIAGDAVLMRKRGPATRIPRE